MGNLPVFTATARAVLPLFEAPELATGWSEPSVVVGFDNGALAAHLARAVFTVETAAASRVDGAARRPISPVQFYVQIQAQHLAAPGTDDEVSVLASGTSAAQGGAPSLLFRLRNSIDRCEELDCEPGRPVMGTGRVLTFSDYLTTRVVELVVHSGELAESLGLPPPEFPPAVMNRVVEVLAGVALQRHGPRKLMRALSRTHRDPEDISAF